MKQFITSPFSLDDTKIEHVYERLFHTIPVFVSDMDLDANKYDEILKVFNRWKVFFSFKGFRSNGELHDSLSEIIFQIEERKEFCLFYYDDKAQIVIKIKKDYRYIVVSIAAMEIEKVDKFVTELKCYVPQKTNCNIFILTIQNGEPVIRDITFNPIKLDVNLDYGAGFSNIDLNIQTKLKTKKGGLYLLFGEADTG